jgi:hypothetical protein
VNHKMINNSPDIKRERELIAKYIPNLFMAFKGTEKLSEEEWASLEIIKELIKEGRFSETDTRFPVRDI